MSSDTAVPTLFGFPLNRIVAFAGPHISWLAGVVATWLTTHVHLLATFHVGQDDTAKAIAQAIVFGVVTAVTYAGQHKWLDGFQKWAYTTGKEISEVDLDGPLAMPEGVEAGVPKAALAEDQPTMPLGMQDKS